MDIRWKHCQLYLLPDPANPSRPRLLFDLTLHFNKLKMDAVLLGSDRKRSGYIILRAPPLRTHLLPCPLLLHSEKRKQTVLTPANTGRSSDCSFTFSLTLMPTPMLGVTHLLAAWAIHKDALTYDFPSVAAMLQKPAIGSGKMKEL